MSICVIGAGIIGLSSAIEIQEREPNCKITLIAEKFSPHVTSDIAAGFWRPVYLGDDKPERIIKWGSETFQFLQKLYREDPVKYGVGIMSGYEVFEEETTERPFWADIVLGFRCPNEEERKSLGYEKCKTAWFYTTYYLMGTHYLALILEKFRSKGGIVVQRKLNNITEISDDFDVVINCTGLGALNLVHDKQCYPVRGQIFRVKAPFVKHFICNDGYYVLLNHDRVILGGTKQKDNWQTEVDAADSDKIFTECVKLVPALKDCTIIEKTVGLRPGRTEIRLELEHQLLNNRTIPVVHCYGHGGSGLTLFYGCAKEVASLASDSMRKMCSKL